MVKIAELLKLWQKKQRAGVKQIAVVHVADPDRRIIKMTAMKNTLQHLAHCCQGDARPDCPILTGLAGADTRPSERA